MVRLWLGLAAGRPCFNLDPTLILTGTHDGLVPNPMRQLANVRQITGDNLNLVSTAGVSASWERNSAGSATSSGTCARRSCRRRPPTRRSTAGSTH